MHLLVEIDLALLQVKAAFVEFGKTLPKADVARKIL
jgi:hypothetical protein